MWQKVNTVPVQSLNIKSHMDKLGVDVIKNNFQWIERKHDGGICTGLCQNRDQCVATVTRMLSIGVQ
jgi:hypothetical protein